MRSGRQDQGAAHRRSGAVRQSGCPSRWEIIRARHQRCAVVLLAVVWHKARKQQSRPCNVLSCLMANPLCYGVLLNLQTDVICFSYALRVLRFFFFLNQFISRDSTSRRPRAGLRSGDSRPVTTQYIPLGSTQTVQIRTLVRTSILALSIIWRPQVPLRVDGLRVSRFNFKLCIAAAYNKDSTIITTLNYDNDI